MKRIALIFLVLPLIASCGTISTNAAGAEALRLLEMVETGDIDGAVDMTARPFLFESEILVSESLVSDLWSALSGVGFSTGELTQVRIVDGDSHQLFDDSWEVRTWMENYTDENTALVFFDWDNRELVVIVDRSPRTERRIQGFGEVR
jgi:hypothetical protein